MDPLDGSYLRGSTSRRQTRATAAAMPPPSQPPFANEPSIIHKSPLGGAYFPNSSLLSPSDTLNSSQQQQHLHSTQIITTDRIPSLGTDENIMSYQKVTKVITNSMSLVDAELRAKEDYVTHLKSIDLSKYSFPNETKPKTDYTYARTSSYRTTELSNDLVNDVMPNLCRRSRRSPPYATNTNRAAISFFNVSAGWSKLNSSFNSVCSYLSNAVSRTNNAQTTAEQIVNAKSLNRRLAYEMSEEKGKILDEENNVARRQTRGSSALRKFAFLSNLYGLDRDSPPPSVVPSQQTPAVTSLTRGAGAKSDANLPKSSGVGQRSSADREVSQGGARITGEIRLERTVLQTESQTPAPPPPPPVHVHVHSRRRVLPWLLLLLLLLLLPLGYKFLSSNEAVQQSQVYKSSVRVYHEHVEPFMTSTVEAGAAVWTSIRDSLSRFYAWIIYRMPGPPTNYPNDGNLERKLNEMREQIMREMELKLKQMKDVEIKDIIRGQFDAFNRTLSDAKDLPVPTNAQEVNTMKVLIEELNARHEALQSQIKELNSKGHLHDEELKKALAIAAEANRAVENFENIVQEKIKNVPHTQTILDKNVTFAEIEEYINRTLYLYNADKTGKTDFASESVGGSVLFTRCTETYMEGARWFTVFDVPITRITVSPRVVIQGTMQPGNCWAFKGSKADLFIKLAARIRPTSFSIEHIPKELSITGNIDSAPQNFTVYGYTNKEEISDDKRLLLGSYRYDNNSKSPLQFFDAMHQYNVPIGVVELKIESNAGNKDYTCLYKFRVHGELFKNGQVEEPVAGAEASEASKSSVPVEHGSKLLNEN